MTLRELWRMAPPPAPETRSLCRQRRWSMGLCMASALAVLMVNPLASIGAAAVLVVPVLVFAAVVVTGLYWRRKTLADAAWVQAEPDAGPSGQVGSR